MKFPRNARIFRGQLDAAPFVSVFFLLVIFVLLGSLVYTPGVRIQLPTGEVSDVVEGPTLAVAVDAAGRFYFRNQLTEPVTLATRLQKAVEASPKMPALVVHADAQASRASLETLASIARKAGITDILLANLPQP